MKPGDWEVFKDAKARLLCWNYRYVKDGEWTGWGCAFTRRGALRAAKAGARFEVKRSSALIEYKGNVNDD